MLGSSNLPNDNVSAAMLRQAGPQVTQAIRTASKETGISFSYLMEKAAAESSFNPKAEAGTSSATGLFQFIDSTWLSMVEKHGEKYGINDNLSKNDVLSLRKDPSLAASMAAELARDNQTYLEKKLDRPINETDLYFAHFMGAGSAAKFLKACETSPSADACGMFPREAAANKAVFYEGGKARNVQDVYDFFARKFETEPGDNVANRKTAVKAYEDRGYQHIPFSLKKPTEIVHTGYGHNFQPAGMKTNIDENPISRFFTNLSASLSMPGNLLYKLFQG